MKKIIKSSLVGLLLIGVLAIGVIYFFPDVLYRSAFGQKLLMKREGDQVAEFYFKDSQKTKDTLYMKGVIYDNTLNDIKEILNNYPEITSLVMEDVTGSINDEINLLASREIRKRSINTYLPEDGMVASGGTDMFLAGKKRHVHPTAKLSVHSWSGADKVALDNPKNDEAHTPYLDYYKEMQIPLDFYWYTLEEATANEMHWMTTNEIEHYQIVTPKIPELLRLQNTLSSDAFYAEELGLHGSKYFVELPPVSLKTIKLNVNFDMISRNPKNEVYAVGIFPYPHFKPVIVQVAKKNSPLTVSFGHDDSKDKTKNYRMFSSDNGPFHSKGIPNITFSEEDHRDYHKSTYDFENINPEYYQNVLNLIQNSIVQIDQNFPIK
jgi:hypothetical protein